jgi:LacI family transcriptional regulator
MQDIAEAIGVSTVTVSKALRGNSDISDSMCDKIKEQASIMGYKYNIAGRMLRNNRTYNMGIITSERYFGMEISFYADLYKLISSYLDKIHYTPLFHILNKASEKDFIIPRIITGENVDGIIILASFQKSI